MGRLVPHVQGMIDTALDAALHRLHATAPTYDGGMSNHGPMAIEALETMGLSEHVDAFTDQALATLEPLDEPGDGALQLGDARQEAAWIEHYRRRIASGSVESVVREALPGLLPGAMAGATHGLIRLAHAVRGWTRHASEVRATEVAHALGYWASAFQTLPGEVGTQPALPLREAMAALPTLGPGELSSAGLILERVEVLERVERFAAAIATVDLREASTPAFISEMVGIAARMMLTAHVGGFAYLHAITATAALRSLLPLVQPDEELAVRQASFHCVAALHVAHGGSKAWMEWAAPPEPPALETLGVHAARTRGEHAIKLAATVLQEYPLHPDPALLFAAQAEITRARG